MSKNKSYYDVEKMNKQLEGITSGKFFKFKEGKNKFRILPRTDGSGTFFLPITQHYGFNDGERGRAYPCIKGMKNQPCPICQFVDALAEMDDADAAKMAKEMGARTSYMINILDRSSGKIKVLSCNPKMLRGIKAILEDEDYGYGVIDPVDGHDWTVNREGSGLQTRYSEPRVSPTPKPLDYNGWEGDIIDLKGEVEMKSAKELAAILKENYSDLIKAAGLKFDVKEEEEEDEEDGDSEDDTKEQAKGKGRKGSGKPAVDDDEDDEEGDDGSDEDDDDEDEEDEDEDFDLDEEEEEIDDEPKKKVVKKDKSKKKGKK